MNNWIEYFPIYIIIIIHKLTVDLAQVPYRLETTKAISGIIYNRNSSIFQNMTNMLFKLSTGLQLRGKQEKTINTKYW